MRAVVLKAPREVDIHLCHPFIVHTAAWPHQGAAPRMIAQAAVHVRDGSRSTDPTPHPSPKRSSRAWRWPIDAARDTRGMITRTARRRHDLRRSQGMHSREPR